MLCSYFLLNATTFFPHVEVLWRAHPPAQALFYTLLFTLSGISFGIALMSLNRIFLLPVVLVVVAIVTTNGLARHLLDLRVVNEQTVEWLVSERGEASDAASAFRFTFAEYLLLSCALTAPALCVTRLARGRFRTRMRPLIWGSCASSVYCLSVFLTDHYFGAFLPVESNLFVLDTRLMLQSAPDLPPADMQPVRRTDISKIVLVVDESVNYHAYVTELRDEWRRWKGVDYGEAASSGNCSAVSNSLLRWGIRVAHIRPLEKPRTPTIWAYARKAGYETWLLDGQRSGSYQNFMTNKEAALIDHYIGVTAGKDTDQAIAKRLNELLREPGKRFVYVNKRGAHFPYSNGYPADRFPKPRNAEQAHSFAVRYSTRGFMDTMLEGVPLGDALIIYTSDHGERFDGASPHCNAHPIAQEFSVPLLLISGNSRLAEQASAAAAKLEDRASHPQIFATILSAMGYARTSAEAMYGPSLLSGSPPAHYFQFRWDKVREFDHFPLRSSEPKKPLLTTTKPAVTRSKTAVRNRLVGHI